MKYKSLLFFAALASQPAFAETTFQPRVFAGAMDLEFSIKNNGPKFIGDRVIIGKNEGSQSVSDTMPLLGLGGTLISGKFFVDAYYQATGEGSYSDVDSNGSLTNISSGSIEHYDAAIAAGMSITDGLSLSLGYKDGSTELGQDFNLNGTPHKTEYQFDLSGPFIGGSYGFPVGNGVIGLNLAIAKLDGEYSTLLTDLSDGDTLPANMEGDATGVTFGINWKAPITENWLYAVSLDSYSYDFDVNGTGLVEDSSGNLTTSNDLDASIEENAVTVRVAFVYRF